jgi:hypothetical protein
MVTMKSVETYQKYQTVPIDQLIGRIEELERTVEWLKNKSEPDEAQLILQKNHPDIFN